MFTSPTRPRRVQLWRVRYCRGHWAPTTLGVRYFAHEAYARRFVDRVRAGDGQAELSRASAPIRWELDQ